MPNQKYTQKDYSDLIKFAINHPELSRTKAIEEARKQGIHTQKKGGLEALRIAFNVEQGKQRGEVIKNLGEAHYTPPPKKRKKKIIGDSFKSKRYLKLDLTREVKERNGKNIGGDIHRIDGRAPAVKTLQQNIKELYGYSGTRFLQIEMSIKNDGYTKLQRFSLLFPAHNRKQVDLKRIGSDICTNLKTYYGNLAKKYSTQNSYKKVKKDVLTNVSSIENELDLIAIESREHLEDLFYKNGIELVSFQILEIVHNGETMQEE